MASFRLKLLIRSKEDAEDFNSDAAPGHSCLEFETGNQVRKRVYRASTARPDNITEFQDLYSALAYLNAVHMRLGFVEAPRQFSLRQSRPRPQIGEKGGNHLVFRTEYHVTQFRLALAAAGRHGAP